MIPDSINLQCRFPQEIKGCQSGVTWALRTFWILDDPISGVVTAYSGICSGSSYHPGSYCGVNTSMVAGAQRPLHRRLAPVPTADPPPASMQCGWSLQCAAIFPTSAILRGG